MRLLPFDGPDGKRAYLSSDRPDSFLNGFADLLEARQLDMGARMLAFAREALERPGLGERELRWLSKRLCEALTDALRVAESRERVPSPVRAARRRTAGMRPGERAE